MAEIEDYVEAAFYRDAPAFLKLPEGFFRQSELLPYVQQALRETLEQFDAADILDVEALAASLFAEMAAGGVFERRGDRFAGVYYSFSQNGLNKFRHNYLLGSEIHAISQTIGGRFYADVFGGYRGANPLTADERVALAVPASDRIVSLQDNQINELEAPIQDLVDQLERDNGVPNEPGVKERLLGQVKAGRELLRAGTFKAYLLHVTIIRALGELIEKYQGSAIAMVAASLVDLLVKHALQVN